MYQQPFFSFWELKSTSLSSGRSSWLNGEGNRQWRKITISGSIFRYPFRSSKHNHLLPSPMTPIESTSTGQVRTMTILAFLARPDEIYSSTYSSSALVSPSPPPPEAWPPFLPASLARSEPFSKLPLLACPPMEATSFCGNQIVVGSACWI